MQEKHNIAYAAPVEKLHFPHSLIAHREAHPDKVRFIAGFLDAL